jgi:hypothetical protein
MFQKNFGSVRRAGHRVHHQVGNALQMDRIFQAPIETIEIAWWFNHCWVKRVMLAKEPISDSRGLFGLL